MMNKNKIEKLLKKDEELVKEGGKARFVYEFIEKEYAHFSEFDEEIKSWLNTMYYFGGWGEFYEMVDTFNKRLFN